MKYLVKVVFRIQSILNGENPIFQGVNSLLSAKDVRNFTQNRLQFSHRVSSALGVKHPRYDRYITRRTPRLEFEEFQRRERIKIDTMYQPSEEIRLDPAPYLSFLRVLSSAGVVTPNTESLVDIGCTSGLLLNEARKQFPNIHIKGLEAFHFLRNSAPQDIREYIEIVDLREDLKMSQRQYEVAICTEVGEHIDPQYLDVFFDNLGHLASKRLILSWSRTYPGPGAPPQHVSVLTTKQIRRIITAWGFIENRDLSETLIKFSKLEPDFHRHWRSSLMVLDKK